MEMNANSYAKVGLGQDALICTIANATMEQLKFNIHK